jgi:hypothetical protein
MGKSLIPIVPLIMCMNNSIEEALQYAYDEYDMEPSEEARELGRLVADLQD